jgi:hypothetical protein
LYWILAPVSEKSYNSIKKKMERRNMNLNTIMMPVLDAVIAMMGVYLIFAGWKMKKTNEISVLLIAEEERKKCKNKERFIQDIYWKEMTFGVVMTIVAVLGFINEFVTKLGKFNYIELAVFLLVFIWFQHELVAARGKYLSNFR